MSGAPESPTSPPNPDSFFVRDGVSFMVDLIGGTSVLTAVGEMDAANVHHLVDCVDHVLTTSHSVVLNLTGLEFFGAQGIQALFEIDDACRRAEAQWTLLASRPVLRLLRICDTDGVLPTVTSIQHALQRFATPESRRLLQLVPQPS